jgi:carboxypeptidase-like protein
MIMLGTSLSAQTQFLKKLEGRVYSPESDVAAVHVLNTTLGKASITDDNGFFSITVKLNDTLVFSAIQFKRKMMVVTAAVLESKMLYVPLQDALTELDEVVVTPYNLSGDMAKDLEKMEIEPVITASTLGLPNAYVKPKTQAERKLFEATTGGGIIPLNPVLNAITGRTKMLKKRIARNEKYGRTQRVRAFYPDSIYQTELKVPVDKISDFMYFCEVDFTFQTVVDSHDQFRIWEFMKKKSIIYRKSNNLE